MNTALKLYEIVDKYKALEALESSDDLPAEVIRDTLEALDGEVREKATNVALFVRNLDTMADSIDDAAKQMQARAARLRKRGESLREYLKFNMLSSGITKIESPFFTLTLKKNPGSVVIDDESKVPAQFMVTPPAPPPRADKKAIAAAIKAGEDVPGCRLEQGERLDIKL